MDHPWLDGGEDLTPPALNSPLGTQVHPLADHWMVDSTMLRVTDRGNASGVAADRTSEEGGGGILPPHFEMLKRTKERVPVS